MNAVTIPAEKRTETGASAARRLRSTGKIPAIAYGRELEPLWISVSPKAVRDVLAGEYGRNTVIDLALEGRRVKVLMREYQYHPVTRELLHADFVEIKDDREVEIDVPFELLGRPKGVLDGGVLRQVFRALPVRCLPKDIPVKITHDVTELGFEQSVAVSEVALPPGCTVRLPSNQTVAAVVGETPEEEEAAAAPAAAAPAAEGATAEKAPEGEAKT